MCLKSLSSFHSWKRIWINMTVISSQRTEKNPPSFLALIIVGKLNFRIISSLYDFICFVWVWVLRRVSQWKPGWCRTHCVPQAGWELGTFPWPLACCDDRHVPPHSAPLKVLVFSFYLSPQLSKLYIKVYLFTSKTLNKNSRFVKFYFVSFLVTLYLKSLPDWSCYLSIIPLSDTEAHHLHKDEFDA